MVLHAVVLEIFYPPETLKRVFVLFSPTYEESATILLFSAIAYRKYIYIYR